MRDLIEPGVPAFEGESFVGEMDLARSAQVNQLAPKREFMNTRSSPSKFLDYKVH